MGEGLAGDELIEHCTDDGDVDEGGDDLGRANRRHVLLMRASLSFRREGKHVMVGDRIIGSVTGWERSVSAHCRIHTQCRVPASTNWPSGAVLEDWLLQAISEDGTQRVDNDVHQAQIAAVALVSLRARSSR